MHNARRTVYIVATAALAAVVTLLSMPNERAVIAARDAPPSSSADPTSSSPILDTRSAGSESRTAVPTPAATIRKEPERESAANTLESERWRGATVFVSVQSTHGVGIPGVGVTATRGRMKRNSATTDLAGVANLGSLSPASYELVVSEATVPDRYLAPWSQEGVIPASPCLSPTEIRVPRGGGEVHATITLCEAAYVAGTVRGADGRALEGVRVRLRSTEPGLDELTADATSDPSGGYRMRVYPSTYRLEVVMRESRAYGAGVQPTPQTVVAEEGARYRCDLSFEHGDRTLVGTVVDQAGLPFGGLTIRCSLDDGERARTTSRDDGAFRFEGLEAETVALHFGDIDDFRPGARPGTNLLGAAPASIPVDLTHDAHVDVGEQTVWRSDPCRFLGQLHVDREWMEEHDVHMSDLRVTLTRIGRAGEIILGKNKHGAFEWSCETPADPIRICVSARRFGDACTEAFPFPGAVVRVPLSYP